MSAQPKIPRRARGVALVEFVICVPVLFVLMLGTAEVGRLLFQYNTLTKAVRDGARYAASRAAAAGGGTRLVNVTTAVRDETRNLVVTGNTAGTGSPLLPGFAASGVTVSDAGNGFVSVTATYTFDPVLNSLPSFGSGAALNLAMPLTSTVIMRAL